MTSSRRAMVLILLGSFAMAGSAAIIYHLDAEPMSVSSLPVPARCADAAAVRAVGAAPGRPC